MKLKRILLVTVICLISLMQNVFAFNTGTGVPGGTTAKKGEWAVYGMATFYEFKFTFLDSTAASGSVKWHAAREGYTDNSVKAGQGYKTDGFGGLVAINKIPSSTFGTLGWYNWDVGIPNGTFTVSDSDIKKAIDADDYLSSSMKTKLKAAIGDNRDESFLRDLDWKLYAITGIRYRPTDNQSDYTWISGPKLYKYMIDNDVHWPADDKPIGAEKIVNLVEDVAENLYETDKNLIRTVVAEKGWLNGKGWDMIDSPNVNIVKPKYKVTVKYIYRDHNGTWKNADGSYKTIPYLPQNIKDAIDTQNDKEYNDGTNFSFTFTKPNIVDTNSDLSRKVTYNKFLVSFYDIVGKSGNNNIRAFGSWGSGTDNLGDAARTQADKIDGKSIVLYAAYESRPTIYACLCSIGGSHDTGAYISATSVTVGGKTYSPIASGTHAGHIHIPMHEFVAGDTVNNLDISAYESIQVNGGSNPGNYSLKFSQFGPTSIYSNTYRAAYPLSTATPKARNLNTVWNDRYITLEYNAPVHETNIVKIFVDEGGSLGSTEIYPRQTFKGTVGVNNINLDQEILPTGRLYNHELTYSHIVVSNAATTKVNRTTTSLSKAVSALDETLTYYVVQEYKEKKDTVDRTSYHQLNKNGVNGSIEVQGNPRGTIGWGWLGTGFNYDIYDQTNGAIPTTQNVYTQLVAASRYLFELTYKKTVGERLYDVTVTKSYPYIYWNNGPHLTSPVCGGSGTPGDGVQDSNYAHQEIGCTHSTAYFTGSCNTTSVNTSGRVGTTGTRYCAKDYSPDCGKEVHNHSGCGPDCKKTAHTHGSSCYHSHVTGCYHSHSSGCYHSHSSGCYHSHSSGCYGSAPLKCSKKHSHTSSCYGTKPLTCSQSTTSANCGKTTSTVICGKTTSDLVCGKTTSTLICTAEEHTHTGCGPTCKKEVHNHAWPDACYKYDTCTGHSDRWCTSTTQYCSSSCSGHARTYGVTKTAQCECTNSCWTVGSYTVNRTYDYKRLFEYNDVHTYDDYKLSRGTIYNSMLGNSGQANFDGVSYNITVDYGQRTETTQARQDYAYGLDMNGHLRTPPKRVSMPSQSNPTGVSSNGSTAPKNVAGRVEYSVDYYSAAGAEQEAIKQASYDLYNRDNSKINDVKTGVAGNKDTTNNIWYYGEDNTYLQVRNERLVEDDGTIMPEYWVSSNRETIRAIAPNPYIPGESTDIRSKFTNNDLAYVTGFTVPATLENGRYSTSGSLTYSKNSPISGKSNAAAPAEKVGWVGGNSTIVHTPVHIDATLFNTAGNANNQSITGSTTNANVIELDKDFQLNFDTIGNHRNTLGYRFNKNGTLNTEKDYGQYVGYVDVRFPFDVYVQQGSDYVFVKQGEWYDVPSGNGSITCRIPVWVKEMAYTGQNSIYVRVKAINDPDPNNDEFLGIRYSNYDSANQNRLYNVNLNDYRAYDQVELEIVGRVYGFQVDFTDDKDWKNTFTYGLINLKSGETVTGLKADLLPFGQKGDNHANKYSEYAARLGYKFKYELKTKGEKANQIQITPSFYYVSKDKSVNTALREVDVYYEIGAGKMEKLDTGNSTFKLTTNLTKPGELPYISSELVRDTQSVYNAYATGQISDLYAPRVLSYNYNSSVAIGHIGRVTLPEGTRLRFNNLDSYDFNDYYGSATATDIIEDAGSYEAILAANSTWFGEYRLPSTSKFVFKDQVVASNGSMNYIREDGYILVCFNIIANYVDANGVVNPYMSYQLQPNNTQWDKENWGYNNRPTLGAGKNRQIILPNGKVINNLADTNNYAGVFVYESILNNGKDAVGSH